MQNGDAMLEKRLIELSERAFSRGVWTFSEFLDMAGQDTLSRARLKSPYTLFGGFDGAERVIACFGSVDICGYEVQPPVACVQISPVSAKFADELTHRDFLGSLMGLGVRREVLGDILITDNSAFLLCLSSISGFITENLKQVKRTTVKTAVVAAPPDSAAPRLDQRMVNAASPRADAVTAAVWKLSRTDSQELFEQKRVFINGRVCENASHTLSEGDVVSLRGFGRYRYLGVQGETKKARLRIAVAVYVS